MLTVKQIDAAKPAEKSYRLADAGGLFLFVPPSGKKVWRMRYRFEGKEKTLVIGPYPQISLTEARAKQADAKMRLLAGVDPAEQKQSIKKKEREEIADSFGDIFKEWHAHKGICRRDDDHVHRRHIANDWSPENGRCRAYGFTESHQAI